jgi:hypothetical protein
MLKMASSVVLASLRGSTYGAEYEFASSLAAALLKAFLNILRDYLALSVTSREIGRSWA